MRAPPSGLPNSRTAFRSRSTGNSSFNCETGGLGTGAAARDPTRCGLLPLPDCRRGVPFGEHIIWQSTHPVRIVEVKTKTKAAFIEQMAGRKSVKFVVSMCFGPRDPPLGPRTYIS